MNSATKERSNSNSNYHNIKYTVLVTETIWIIGERERWLSFLILCMTYVGSTLYRKPN